MNVTLVTLAVEILCDGGGCGACEFRIVSKEDDVVWCDLFGEDLHLPGRCEPCLDAEKKYDSGMIY